ncbi:MAG: hypothetical protein KME26_21290 [Oscillatoria princeps RMCB-10]|nr:hypothetical protein [Oscillatoria princeps RMCB-10]
MQSDLTAAYRKIRAKSHPVRERAGRAPHEESRYGTQRCGGEALSCGAVASRTSRRPSKAGVPPPPNREAEQVQRRGRF